MATTSSRMLGYHLLRLSTVVLLLKVPLVHALVADDESFAALWASSPVLTCDAALVSSCSDSAQIKCLFRASHRVSDLIKTSLPREQVAQTQRGCTRPSPWCAPIQNRRPTRGEETA